MVRIGNVGSRERRSSRSIDTDDQYAQETKERKCLGVSEWDRNGDFQGPTWMARPARRISLACLGVTGEDPPDTCELSATPMSAAPRTWMMADSQRKGSGAVMKEPTGHHIGRDEDCL